MTNRDHSYRGRHAEFYDLFYAAKPYVQEAAFVHRCIEMHGDGSCAKHLLELACGTGNHAIHMAKLGYEILATDNSPEMVREAEKKSAVEKLKIVFRVHDMRDLARLPGIYDVVICLFDSIGYVQTDAGLDAVFAGVNARLRKGGLFIFEFWHAPPMLSAHDPVRVRRFSAKDATVLRISETTLQPERSLAQVAYSIYELRDDGTYSALHETQTNRFFTLSEIEARAPRHGFAHTAAYAGFQTEAEISDQTWHIVAVWRKQ